MPSRHHGARRSRRGEWQQEQDRTPHPRAITPRFLDHAHAGSSSRRGTGLPRPLTVRLSEQWLDCRHRLRRHRVGGLDTIPHKPFIRPKFAPIALSRNGRTMKSDSHTNSFLPSFCHSHRSTGARVVSRPMTPHRWQFESSPKSRKTIGLTPNARHESQAWICLRRGGPPTNQKGFTK